MKKILFLLIFILYINNVLANNIYGIDIKNSMKSSYSYNGDYSYNTYNTGYTYNIDSMSSYDSNKNIYFGGFNGELWKINNDLTLNYLNETNNYGNIKHNIIIEGNYLYIVGLKKLFKVNKDTGITICESTSLAVNEVYSYSNPKIYNDNIYVASTYDGVLTDGHLTSFDKNTCNRNWDFNIGSGGSEANPAILSNDKIAISSYNSNLYIINSNGTSYKNYTASGQCMEGISIDSLDNIYFYCMEDYLGGSLSSTLYSVDKEANLNWQQSIGSNLYIYGTNLIIDNSNNYIYLSVYNELSTNFKLLKINKNNGDILYSYEYESYYPYLSFLDNNNTILISTSSGKIIWIEANTGVVKKYVNFSDIYGFVQPINIDSNGKLYITGWEGILYIFNSTSIINNDNNFKISRLSPKKKEKLTENYFWDLFFLVCALIVTSYFLSYKNK